jgi:YHS domain-containing protein
MGWIRWAIIVFLLCCLYRLLRPRRLQRHSQAESSEIPREAVMVQDPCCKTFILKDQALEATVQGKIVHFCSTRCRERYLEQMDAKKS